MGDQNKAVSFNQDAGQPTGEPAGEPQPNETQQFLTLEQAQALAKEAEERAFRRAQGLIDKGNQKYRDGMKALETQLHSLQSVGVQVTPEQEAQLRAGVYEQAFTPEQSPVSKDGQPSPEGEQDTVDPITAEAWRLMDEAGVTLEDEDPETATLDQTSPYKFLQSIEKAIEAKKARVNGAQNVAAGQFRAPTNAGAVGSPANPISTIIDPDELLTMGLKG